MAPVTRSRKLSGGGSPSARPAGEPQTARKEAEKATAPLSPSLEAPEEEDEEEEEEEERDEDECIHCFKKGDVYDNDLCAALCQRHAFAHAFNVAIKAGGRRGRRHAPPPCPEQGTPEAEEQAARQAQIRRLKRRRKQAESDDDSQDSDELSPGEAASRRQARNLLRVRYVLRRGHPADVVRYLRAAVRFADNSSAAAATALAALLPESRWPGQVRPGGKRAACAARARVLRR